MAIGSKVGLSLILKGIEKGFNDKAREREIMIHGAHFGIELIFQANQFILEMKYLLNTD
jgi:hypothetical protein